MATFKLLKGNHVVGRGPDRVIHQQGDKFKSDLDLDVRFGEDKFKRLSPRPTDEFEDDSELEDSDLEDATRKPKKKLKKKPKVKA